MYEKKIERSGKRLIVGVFMILAMIVALLLVSTSHSYAVSATPDSGWKGKDAGCKSSVGDLITLKDLKDNRLENKPRLFPSTGKLPTEQGIPLLTIVVGFQNISYDNNYDWASSTFRQDESVSSYYKDMSLGNFTFVPAVEHSAFGIEGNTNTKDIANDGVVHVTLNRDHSPYNIDDTSEEDYELFEAIQEALTEAGKYVDFSAYDLDQNGKISTEELSVCFIFAGFDASVTDKYPQGKEFYIWPHHFELSSIIQNLKDTEYGELSLPEVQGVTFDNYLAIAENRENSSAFQQEPISVMAHELGHFLGLPDLYDVDYDENGIWSAWEVDCMSLMASGGHFDIPVSLDIWSRCLLGWVKPVYAKKTGTYDVISQNYSSNTLKAVLIPTKQKDEYYLLENRQYTKWDQSLEGYYGDDNETAGIVLWHVDDRLWNQYKDLNRVNSTDHRPMVMPLYPEDSETVYQYPFFDSVEYDLCASVGTSPCDINGKLGLLVYGNDEDYTYPDRVNADDPDSRFFSGITVEFLTESAESMSVKIDMDAVTDHMGVDLSDYDQCTRDLMCPFNWGYTDLDSNEWYHDGIHWAMDYGVMKGTGNSRFEPNTGTSRAMIATMLWRLEGSPLHSEFAYVDGEGNTYGCTFNDVTPDDYFYDAVCWAQQNGIIEGYNQNTFGPHDVLTREQMATLIYRFGQYEGANVSDVKEDLSGFSDAGDVSDWAIDAMKWNVFESIVKGIGEDMLAPKSVNSRAQVATMLMRYVTQVRPSDWTIES